MILQNPDQANSQKDNNYIFGKKMDIFDEKWKV